FFTCTKAQNFYPCLPDINYYFLSVYLLILRFLAIEVHVSQFGIFMPAPYRISPFLSALISFYNFLSLSLFLSISLSFTTSLSERKTDRRRKTDKQRNLKSTLL
ncbi:hypothetical protein EGW08_017402, partial [Elysia chlorotica]